MNRPVCFRCKGSGTQSYEVSCMVCGGIGYSNKLEIGGLEIGDQFRYTEQLWQVEDMTGDYVTVVDVYTGEVDNLYHRVIVTPWNPDEPQKFDTISDVIRQLQNLQSIHGDIPVVGYDRNGRSPFSFWVHQDEDGENWMESEELPGEKAVLIQVENSM